MTGRNPAMISDFSPTNRQLFVSLQMIADELDSRLWNFTLEQGEISPCFRGFQVYTGQKKLQHDFIYLLQRGNSEIFPTDHYSYLTEEDITGDAPHIRCLDRTMLEIINEITQIFQKYRDLEAELNWIVNDGGSLTDLCRVASAFFQNPIYIHDSVFTVIALSNYVEGMLKFDFNPETGKYYIPLWLIEDFKFSAAYTRTLQERHACIWGLDQHPYHMRSLFMNIWDGDYCRARLLVNELHEPLKPGQFKLVEYLAEYVKIILRRDEVNTARRNYRNFEDTVKELAAGQEVAYSDLHILLTMLGWHENDQYLCVKMQSQKPDIAVTSCNVLRSKLSAVFSGIISTFSEQQLCVIVNLTISGNDPLTFRSRLAPLLRDSYMYGGASFPLSGINLLSAGFRQADLALEQAFKLQSSQWFIPFEDCALSYMLEHIDTQLPPEMLAAPAIISLQQHDRKKGSQYYDTLRCYLQCERRIPDTADALIIHRTTLIYRLEKIRELIKVDLEDEAVRLYLLLSFRILDGGSRRDSFLNLGPVNDRA